MRFEPASLVRSTALRVVSAAIRPKFFFILSTIMVSAALGASTTQQPRNRTPSSPTVLPEADCAGVAPDAEYFIPENFTRHDVPSGSGRYGYRQRCPFWVVDFSMNSKANSYLTPEGSRVRERTLFFGLPHDLPSSSSAAGWIPIVKEDCERLRLEYIIYSKFKHESNFVLKRHITATASWSGTCNLSISTALPQYHFMTRAPEANVLVIRVATRVKLRTSWQEVAAIAEDAPPQ
jgi:hypothetical protein